MSMTSQPSMSEELYDPDLHQNQIVAVYANRSAAEQARDSLVQAGVPASAIEVLDRGAEPVAGEPLAERGEHEGFWGAVKNLFAPEDDYHAYNHAIERGHAMVVVTPASGMDRHHVIEVLERSDPIDFDEQQTSWRETGYGRSTADLSAGATGAPVGMGASMMEPTTGMSAGTPAAVARDVAAPLGDDKIQVVQERLRVGKREVANGAVRVRSYVVERPVEEQVRLRSETVSIDRRPVDRPLEPGEDAFRERTLEARATGEEAVVSKDARVVEEIGVRKDVAERTETVRDNIRETKVEVEDGTTATVGTRRDTVSPL